ncbi:MAG TPA: CDP-archaeol synthase [Actinomycetota bacterium]|nr:CDP-archaeol synthase [Actinomycetota bacterium]
MIPQPRTRGGRNLATAVVTALVLVAVLVAAYLLGADAVFWLAAVVVLLALYELLDAVARTGRRPPIAFALACAFVLMAAAYFRPDDPELVVVALGVATFGSLALALRPARGRSAASDVAWTVAAVAWIGGAGAAAVSMLTLAGGLDLLVAHVLVTAIGDIGAYFVGVRFGRRKLAPSISPGKSWEGFAAGLVCALAAGTVAGLLLDQLTAWDGVAVGALVGVLAPVGDLAESLAKRELGIKDSGRLLPGHGGFLDRIDAIVFCAPIVLLYLRAVVA